MESAREAIWRLPVRTFGAKFWLVDLSAVPTAAELECLSNEEQARASRFVFDEHRRRFRMAHLALRRLLAEEVGIDAAAIEYLSGPNGKPALHEDFGVSFNMSHSDELALIATARDLPADAEIGVDIESLREVRNTGELAAMNFTALEQHELAHVAPRERNWFFLSGWTRKEACLKAIGSGLSISPQTFECALAPVRALTRIPTPQGARTVEVESVDVQDGHLAAIAITVPAADD
jgi:4'-phosphopantetheinyl transferase